MAVMIRMQRAGAKNKPAYRIVVADSRFQRDGRFIEKVGHYNPLPVKTECVLDIERVDYWLSKGATASEAVSVLIKRAKAAVPASA